jgi:hypothetical protein
MATLRRSAVEDPAGTGDRHAVGGDGAAVAIIVLTVDVVIMDI